MNSHKQPPSYTPAVQPHTIYYNCNIFGLICRGNSEKVLFQKHVVKYHVLQR